MSPAMKLSLPDAAATEALGQALARALDVRALTVLYLEGDLGTGKTTLARSVLRALGVAATIRSPTYTLIENYAAGGLEALHLDLYRLRSPLEVEELGLREQLGPGMLVLIEWPERGGAALPRADLRIGFSYQTLGRAALLEAAGTTGDDVRLKLRHDASLTSYLPNLT